jgi:hypothetical protein
MMQATNLWESDNVSRDGWVYGARFRTILVKREMGSGLVMIENTTTEPGVTRASKGDELKFKGGAATKAAREYGKEGGHNRDHTQDGLAAARKSLGLLDVSEF